MDKRNPPIVDNLQEKLSDESADLLETLRGESHSTMSVDDLNALIDQGSSDELRSLRDEDHVDLSGVDSNPAQDHLSQGVDAQIESLSNIDEDTQDKKPPVLMPAKQYHVLVSEIIQNSRSREKLSTVLSSIGPIRSVGYLLIMLFALDMGATLYPVQMFNPNWEMAVISAFVDRMVVPLLGIALIFWGGLYSRKRFDVFVLWMASWGSLVAAVFLMLLIPMSLLDTLRLQSAAEIESTAQLDTQELKLKQVVNAINQVKTIGEMQKLIEKLSKQAVVLDGTSTLESLRQSMIQKVEFNWETMEVQAKASQERKVLEMWKRLGKIVAGLILGVVFLFYLWRSTLWARLEWREMQKK